ncbi:MAG: NAD(P)/FAD-dependent oxidoreductase [Methanocellales archaeon]
MNIDLLIVGSSPAGLMAAKRAAELLKQEFSIILIDKKEKIGIPPSPANTFFKTMWDRTGEELDREYVLNEVKGMHIISPALHRMEIKTPGYVIDRAKFDQHYARELEKLGVEIHKAEAKSLLKNGRRIAGVQIDQGDINLNSKLTIIANGVESELASATGLKLMKYPEDIAWAFEVEVQSKGIGEAEVFEYYIGSIAPGWKATYSPYGDDRASLGIYIRGFGREIEPFFHSYVEKFKRIKGIEVLKMSAPKRGGDPIATIPNEIAGEGVMITGGACGQSGICYAMLAGKIAGEVAAKALIANNLSREFLRKYELEWKKNLQLEYQMGRAALELIKKMRDEEIDAIARAFEKEDISRYLKGSPWGIAFKLGMQILKKSPNSILLISRLMLDV